MGDTPNDLERIREELGNHSSGCSRPWVATGCMRAQWCAGRAVHRVWLITHRENRKIDAVDVTKADMRDR